MVTTNKKDFVVIRFGGWAQAAAVTFVVINALVFVMLPFVMIGAALSGVK